MEPRTTTTLGRHFTGTGYAGFFGVLGLLHLAALPWLDAHARSTDATGIVTLLAGYTATTIAVAATIAHVFTSPHLLTYRVDADGRRRLVARTPLPLPLAPDTTTHHPHHHAPTHQATGPGAGHAAAGARPGHPWAPYRPPGPITVEVEVVRPYRQPGPRPAELEHPQPAALPAPRR